ncbi:membrane protein [Mangrovimonas yunxiaonensis]|uniref:Membrane protein n=1 Tax=Mangrovimonas yunxiaonensis TaxID=1197477 RepID=A0A084TJ70_9FLAO|nr:DUF4105 domain-containing protein [Mangrovimonas yunxiaonensis]KFB00756.1 membrane protein [Mangrovimonas yunxiaonensis]GGH45890.1 membrane protein [Mangrovimonas yunxiaonensis]
MKQFFWLVLLIGFTLQAQHRPLSNQAQISVLTIGPGSSLNDAFGHNAFRIKDPTNNLDITFDYGRFDFNTPNFYLKFATGKLNYAIGKSNYKDIYGFYTWQNRSIQEQVLQLSQAQKQALYSFLNNNYKPENRYYLYDFFYDNCATKIKEVVVQTAQEPVVFNPPANFSPKTFRTLIQDNLHWNTWGSLGIDIALGAVIDKTANLEEHMFLPAYIHTLFEGATLNQTPLVATSRPIHTPTTTAKTTSLSALMFSPLVIFLILGGIVGYITYRDAKRQTRSRGLDVLIFGITGCIGIALMLLWFATNHQATANNYNLLWAFPLNLIIITSVWKKAPLKPWVRKYLKLLVICLALMGLHWISGVQQFAFALMPLLLALMLRYVFLIKSSR